VTHGVTHKLESLFRGLEALYQIQTGLDVAELLLPPQEHGARETLYLRDDGSGALEVGLSFDRATLDHLSANTLDEALTDEGLGATLPVLEGLSHLVYVAEAARRERPVSGLELETQAEVDKLAICLLHRWPPSRAEYRDLVDRLYHRFEFTTFGQMHRARYESANRLAAQFARHLQPHVESNRIVALRQALRGFWSSTMSGKRQLAA